MAITYVGGKGAGLAGATGTINVSLTTGWSGGSGGNPQENDLLVIVNTAATQGRQPNLDIGNSWVNLTCQRTTATTYDVNTQISYKKMGATPDASVDIPRGGNVDDGSAYEIMIFRGVDPDTPMDVTPTYLTGSGTNNRPNPQSITPVTPGAYLVFGGGGAASVGTTVFTASYCTVILSHNGNDTNDGTSGLAYLGWSWDTGAYDGAAFGGGSVNAANSWGCTTLALRPAPSTTNGFLTSSPGAAHGDTTGGSTANRASAQKFVCPGSGAIEITEIGLWCSADVSTTGAFKLAIFTDDAGNINPDTMVANSETAELTNSDTAVVKVSHTYGTKPQLTGGTTYWLARMHADVNLNVSMFYPGGVTINYGGTYPTWPTAANWDSGTTAQDDPAIYAVYRTAFTREVAEGGGGAGVVEFDYANGFINIQPSSPQTWSHTTGAQSNRALFVGVWSANVEITGLSVTYDGVSLTFLDSYDMSGIGGSGWMKVYYLPSEPSTGTKTMSLSWAGGPPDIAGAASISFYNVDQTTRYVSANTAKNAGASRGHIDLNVTTSTGNMAVGFHASGNVFSGQTAYATDRFTLDRSGAYYLGNERVQTQVGNGSVEIHSDHLTDYDISIGIDVKAAAGGSGGLGITDSVVYSLFAGGTTFTRKISDALGFTDSQFRILSYARKIADAIGVVDATRLAKSMIRYIADAENRTDAVGRRATFGRLVANDLGLTDAQLRAAAWKRYFTEALGIDDRESAAKGQQRILADGLGIADAANRYFSARRYLGDAVGITDAFSRRQDFARQLADALGIDDQEVRRAVYGRRATEALGLTDTASALKLLTRVIAEALGITDARLQAAGFRRIFADTVGYVDAQRRASALARLLSEALGITDQAARKVAFSREVREALGIADAAGALKLLIRILADQLGIQDEESRKVALGRIVTEAIGLTDAQSRASALRRILADVEGITDASLRRVSFFRTLTEALGIDDRENVLKMICRAIADAFGLTDYRSVTLEAPQILRTIADTLSIADTLAVTKFAVIVRAVADNLGVTDARWAAKAVRRILSEQMGITDFEDETKQIRRYLTELVGLADDVEKASLIIRRLTDLAGITDSAIAGLSQYIVRTIADTIGLTDRTSRLAAVLTWLALTIAVDIPAVKSEVAGAPTEITIDSEVLQPAIKTEVE